MKVIRKIIEIDEEKCDSCGNCVPACAEGTMEVPCCSGLPIIYKKLETRYKRAKRLLRPF